jgi:thioredoxin-dependent peroxiredoxin
MSQVTLKGNPIQLSGEMPAIGQKLKDFRLTASDLSEKSLMDFEGKKILNIVPSLDTATCATSARKFNEEAASHAGVNVLVISADLPFAQKRFCVAEGIDRVTPLSTFRSSFPKDTGVEITSGPLTGLTARSVIVLDDSNQVIYTELVSETTEEPDYASALQALQ